MASYGQKSSDAGASTSSGTSKRTKSYTDLLEKAIPAGVFMFRDSARKENHESLGKICGAESSLFKKVGVLASIALKRKHNVTIIIS